MKNKLSDLNNHLFAQLERLGDEQLKGDKLAVEIERAKAISSVATQIVNSAKVAIDAMKLIHTSEAPDSAKKLIGYEM